MTYIKIFLASSIEELGAERLYLSDFIRSLNDSYIRRNIYFELIICENISNSLYHERKQQEYNQYIGESQFFYILIGQNIGQYTLEEFNVALQYFKQEGAPKIYTYFKNLPKNVAPSQSILDFVKHLDEELGHYYSTFSHVDTIKLNILLELSRCEEVGGTVSLEDGYAWMDGKPVVSMHGIPVYQKNEFLQKLVQERSSLETEYGELIDILALKPDSQLLKKKIEENTQKRNALLEQQHSIEKEILGFYSLISEKRQLEKQMNWREKKALEMVDRGDYEGAKNILKDEQWTKELSQSENIIEQKLNDVVQYISGKRTLIQAIRATGITAQTEQEIIACYEDIVSLAEKYGVEMYVLREYASFLMHHNMHVKAIPICHRLNNYYAYKQEISEACASNKYLLACILYKINDLNASEQFHREALAIRGELCKKQTAYSLANYAASCNQLGYLLFRMKKLQEAQQRYQEGIALFRDLAKKELKLKTNLALILNNMGVLMQHNKDFSSAKNYFQEALIIRRSLAESNTTVALGFLAMGCLNYAKLMTEIGETEIANTYYLEAIDLYANLCSRDSKFKVDHAIAQYYLATTLEATDEKRALALHRSALTQRIELGKSNPKALKADIARSYFAVGKLELVQDPMQAKQKLELAYQLWKELKHQAPEKFAEEFSLVESYMNAL